MGTVSGNSQTPIANIPLPPPPSASFDTAVAFTLVEEGGYSNEPADAGGPTNFGITQQDFSDFLGRQASADDVRNMSLDTAKAIYRASYWAEALGQLSQPKATAIFDWGVLHGVESARVAAQRVANGLGCSVDVDGIIGPQSVASLNKLADHAFCQAYAASIRATFDAIIAGNPSQAVFKNGWYSRAARIAGLA